MHLLHTAIIALSLLFSTTGRDAPEKELFVGSTPCGQLIRPQMHIPANKACALVKWQLILQRNPQTNQPESYQLTAYSHHLLPDNNYSQPGVKTESSGKWNIVKGTGQHARYMICQLNPDTPGATLRFVLLSANLMHLIDKEGRFVAGDPFQSYTLNRKTAQ